MQYDKFAWYDFIDAVKKRDVIIFGAAQTGADFYNKYHDYVNIVGVYDNCKDKWNQQVYKLLIEPPENIQNLEMENIVCVIASQYWFQIISQIKEYGVKYYFVYPVFEDNKNYEKKQLDDINTRKIYHQWKFQYNCYAHALGTIDGVRYTNSLEALIKNIDCGFKMFEMDLAIVNEEVILCHTNFCMKHIQYVDGRVLRKNTYNSYNEEGWPYSFEQLRDEKIYGKYTPLKFIDICDLMQNNKEMHIILHLHYRNPKERKVLIESISSIVGKYDEEFKNRIILQISSEEMKKEADTVGNFQNYTQIFDLIPIKYILERSERCGINTIVVEYRAIDEFFISFFHERGYKIAIYGAYRKEDLKQLKQLGVDVFCLENGDMLEEIQ